KLGTPWISRSRSSTGSAATAKASSSSSPTADSPKRGRQLRGCRSRTGSATCGTTTTAGWVANRLARYLRGTTVCCSAPHPRLPGRRSNTAAATEIELTSCFGAITRAWPRRRSRPKFDSGERPLDWLGKRFDCSFYELVPVRLMLDTKFDPTILGPTPLRRGD